jgi:hypothetical protein
MNAIVQRLFDSAVLPHAKEIGYDNEGYPVAIRVCAKWKTLQKDSRTSLLYGRLDENTKCSCGADEHNAQLLEVALELDKIVTR